MKYNVECLVDEYVSCAADIFLAKKQRLPNITFVKKGQGVNFNSAKEFEPYARGFNGLAQIGKVAVKAEPNGPEPKKDIEVSLKDLHKFDAKPEIKVESKVMGKDIKSEKPIIKKIEVPKEKSEIKS